MPLIHLQGRLICRTAEERRAVLAHLPLHIRQTLREPGCLFFDLKQDDDPAIWHVNEGFASQAAYGAHQSRTAGSDWGRATLRIRRDYSLMEAMPAIAPETEADHRALFLLAHMAFGRPDEAKLIERLRQEGSLAASLVARFNRAYLGHLPLIRLPGPVPLWLLGPFCVRQPCRGQGIARALVQAGLEAARRQGVAGIFAFSSPDWLGHLGFQPAPGLAVPNAHGGTGFAQHPMRLLRLTDRPLPAWPLPLPAPVSDYLSKTGD